MTHVYTFVVVAYHRPDRLRRLLDGVAGDPDGPTRIVVVNVDGDPDVQQVALQRGATVVPVANDGYAASVNRGIAEVDTELVIFSGDDLEVTGPALRTLLAPVTAGLADVAVPQLMGEDGLPQATVRPLPTPGRILLEWAATGDRPLAPGRIVQKWRRPRVTETVDAFDAALVATRTNLLRTEPLPEDYFLYWEELDWSYRLHAGGRRVVIVPAALAVHAGGRADVRPDKQRLLARNAVRCVYRTQGRAAAARAWPVVILWQLRLFVVDAIRAIFGRGNRVAARAAGVGAAVGAWRELTPAPSREAA